MPSSQFNFQSVALALGFIFLISCEETTEPVSLDGPTGFNDNEDLGQCTLEFTNKTGYLLTHGLFEPTDLFGIFKELSDLPIEDGDTRTMTLQVGVYQMKVNHQLYKQPPYYFTSFNHICIKDQILEVTATIEDLKIGMLEVINESGFTVTSVLLASTDDLIFGDNLLDGVLEDGDETLISTDPGRFYWLLEDSEGNFYFGNTRIYGSIDGGAVATAETKIDSDDLCTLTLANGTGVAIDAICIMEEGVDYEGVWISAAEVFDSRGNLPDSQSLDILLAPGTWTLGAGNYYGSNFLITDLICSDGQPLDATLTSEDVE